MLSSLPSSAQSWAFLLTTNTGAPQCACVWACVCVCMYVIERERERWIVGSLYMSISQNWNNELPVRFLPYLPPMVCPNVICCNRKGRTTVERVREEKTKQAVCMLSSFSDAWFNELWNPPLTTKYFTLSTDKRRAQCLLHELHHKEPHSLHTQHRETSIWYNTNIFSWLFGRGQEKNKRKAEHCFRNICISTQFL